MLKLKLAFKRGAVSFQAPTTSSPGTFWATSPSLKIANSTPSPPSLGETELEETVKAPVFLYFSTLIRS